MTREEHIENLKAIASDMPSDKCSDWIESLMAGVKALEQEPCTDAISRQSVIDTLTKTSGIRGDALKALYDLPSVTPQPNVGSSSEKPNKWIPCSERLPEEHKEVLTCSLGGFIEIQSYEDGCGGYWENQKGNWTDICEVVAWMSLPEPTNKSEVPTGQISANGELYPGKFDDPLAEEGSDKK